MASNVWVEDIANVLYGKKMGWERDKVVLTAASRRSIDWGLKMGRVEMMVKGLGVMEPFNVHMRLGIIFISSAMDDAGNRPLLRI
jgi:hypothetical protein